MQHALHGQKCVDHQYALVLDCKFWCRKVNPFHTRNTFHELLSCWNDKVSLCMHAINLCTENSQTCPYTFGYIVHIKHMTKEASATNNTCAINTSGPALSYSKFKMNSNVYSESLRWYLKTLIMHYPIVYFQIGTRMTTFVNRSWRHSYWMMAGHNLSDTMLYHSPTAAEKQNLSFTKLAVAVVCCSNNWSAAYAVCISSEFIIGMSMKSVAVASPVDISICPAFRSSITGLKLLCHLSWSPCARVCSAAGGWCGWRRWLCDGLRWTAASTREDHGVLSGDEWQLFWVGKDGLMKRPW